MQFEEVRDCGEQSFWLKRHGQDVLNTVLVIIYSDNFQISGRRRYAVPVHVQLKDYFEFNDDSLTSGGREKLEFTAECLKRLDNVSLVLEGHADDRGAPEYNLGLGDKRARNVLQYLTNLGVSASRLDWRSKGENEPLCMNPTEDCWAQNRRVELIAR